MSEDTWAKAKPHGCGICGACADISEREGGQMCICELALKMTNGTEDQEMKCREFGGGIT